MQLTGAYRGQDGQEGQEKRREQGQDARRGVAGRVGHHAGAQAQRLNRQSPPLPQTEAQKDTHSISPKLWSNLHACMHAEDRRSHAACRRLSIQYPQTLARDRAQARHLEQDGGDGEAGVCAERHEDAHGVEHQQLEDAGDAGVQARRGDGPARACGGMHISWALTKNMYMTSAPTAVATCSFLGRVWNCVHTDML